MTSSFGVRHANPTTRPEEALDDLYALMNDKTISMRNRIFAARSASRVEPLGLTGQEIPPAVQFLRNIVNFRHNGKPYSAEWRHMAASALAYWERRAKQAAAKYTVADTTEQTTAWRRILNGIVRYTIAKNRQWPDHKDTLIPPNLTAFNHPAHDPDLALNAILIPADRQQKSRRKNAVDQPDKPIITSNQQRLDILNDIATAITLMGDKASISATFH